jgi:hypothetical protein
VNIVKRLSYVFMPLPLAVAAAAQEKSIRIGYAECASNNPASTTEKAAALKWYFAHASVGANMVDGLTDLGKKDSKAYPYATVFTEKAPPAETKPGTVYEHNRGNPGWQTKFDQFAECVSNGWHSPKVDIAMNKLCYIDQTASAKYYIRSMTNLEAAFPETTFVYMTMPLTTETDSDNYLRNGFNDNVRQWTKQNGRVLFDLADMEAHDSNGSAVTFSKRNRTCQRLCGAYTMDGGHLNEAGRQLVARGFYALASALQDKNSRAQTLNAAK